MAFTPEQQLEIDVEIAKRIGLLQATQDSQIAYADQQHAKSMELQVSSQQAAAALQAAQNATNLEIQAKQARLSAVQLAQSTLISNRSNQPVETREISVQDITNFAEQLAAYINQ
jgi:hypothetical protein